MTAMHDGHRQRLRDRFGESGLDGFNDINVLELLLFYVLPRQDTNPVAHRLLDRFGSLSGVLDAAESDLRTVEGIGAAGAQFFPLLRALELRADRQRETKNKRAAYLRSPEDMGSYLLPFFYGKKTECVYLLSLNLQGRVLDCRKVFDGSVNAVAVSTREIIKTALQTEAEVCVLAHNHPTGLCLPSGEDLDATEAIFRALRAVSVLLADHIIVSGGEYYNIASTGLLRQLVGSSDG